MFEQICAYTISRITNGPVVKETLVIIPMAGDCNAIGTALDNDDVIVIVDACSCVESCGKPRGCSQSRQRQSSVSTKMC